MSDVEKEIKTKRKLIFWNNLIAGFIVVMAIARLAIAIVFRV